MNPTSLNRLGFLALGFSLAVLPAAVVAAATRDPARPDLGTLAAGTYVGDVISDSQGSSREHVTLTVRRVTRNTVAVTSDYPRLPAIAVTLERDQGMILAHGGDNVFNLDTSKSPPTLTVSFHNEVTWQGEKSSSSAP